MLSMTISMHAITFSISNNSDPYMPIVVANAIFFFAPSPSQFDDSVEKIEHFHIEQK